MNVESTMCITKPCTQLHPPPPSSLQQPQQYSNQNTTRNWTISPNLGRKIQSCPFWQNWFTWYLGGADSEYRLRISKFRPQTPYLGKFGPKRTKLSVLSRYWHAWYLKDADAYSYISFVNFQTKIHFRQIWAKKVKVVRFVWKLTHMVPRGWWFLFQELFSGFQTKNRFLVIFRPKKSNLCILVEDGTHGISRNRILIPKSVFWISKPKFILGQSEFPEVKLPVLSDVVTQRILRVLICFNWNL